jgi:hypothetical protein
MMAGFDLSTAKPVTGFDLSTARPAGEGMPMPRRSWSDVGGEALANAPGSASKFVGGVVQSLVHPIDTLTSISDLAAGGFYNAMPKAVQSAINAIEINPEAQQQAIKTANVVGGEYKQRYGDMEKIKATLATDPVGAAADLSMIFSGGASATSRVAPTVSKALTTAATVTNPMVPIVGAANLGIKATGVGGKAVFNALDPKSKAYMTAAEGRTPEIINALLNAPTFVPGSMPTAAQAAAPVGSTRFAALGRQAAEKLPTDYLARETAQKEAQLAAIRGVGKTEADVIAAEAARTSTTTPLYKIADQAVVPADSTFTALTARPSMDKVLARAKQLAEEKGQTFQIGQNAPAQTVPSPILGPNGLPVGSTTIPAQVASYPGSSLHFMKLAFDDLIRDPATFGIGKNEVNAISNTRGQFMNWFESKVPEYGQARALFSAGSKPINQMQIGQFLEGKLTPILGEETGRLRAAGFATAVENAPATIKKASTGAPLYDNLSKIMSPEQIAVIDGIKDDLSRIAAAEYQGRKGAKAGPDLLTVGSEALAGLQSPSFLNRAATLANEIVRRLKGGVNEKMAIEIATEMLDPQAAATALMKAKARQVKGEKMFDPFAQKVSAEKVRNIGAVQNALAPENQNALAQ